MRYNFTIVILLAGVVHSKAQQEAIISSYLFNQLPINPGYVGVNDVTSFDVHYRSQWGNIEGAPETVFLSGQTAILDTRLGLGGTVWSDRIGIINNTEVNANVGYEADLFRNVSLSLGIQAGIRSLQYDYDKLNLEVPDDDFVGGSGTLTKLNLGTGLFLSGENFYAGASLPRIVKVTEVVGGSEVQLYTRHYYLTGGLILDPINLIRLKCYSVVRIAEDSKTSIEAGSTAFLAGILWAGLYTRNLRDFGVNLTLVLDQGLRIGYAGELTTNQLNTSNLNAHEVTVGIDLHLLKEQLVVKRYY